MARKLQIEIVGDSSSYERALGRASNQSTGFASSLGRMAKMGALAAGAAGIGALVVTLKQGFQEISDSQKVIAQTNAVLKSTGGIANVTAKHVDELATAQSRLTGIDDELVQAGENLLLTFKNVRNEVGKGNAVFDRATKSALDLSVAGFGSVETASKMMGKALNDPIKGMTALGRSGITFSEEQKKAIKALVETGDTLAAQKLILAEVESQVGGSARAYGETLPGQLAKAKNSFDEVAGQLTMSLLPAVTRALDGFNRFLVFVQENMPKWKAAVVENSKPVIEILTRVWSWIQTNLLPVFRQMAQVAVEEWTKIAGVFQTHGPEIRRIIERVTAVVEPLIKAWLFLAQNVVIPIIKPLFTVIIPAALGITISVLDKATAAVEAIIRTFQWLGKNTASIWGKVRDAISSVAGTLFALLEPVGRVLGTISNYMKDILRLADSFLGAIGKVGGMIGGVAGKIPGFQHGVKNFGGGLAVVGEGGPELVRLPRGSDVIPSGGIGGLQMAGGGGVTIVVNAPNYVGDKRDLSDAMQDVVLSWQRRNGGSFFG